ncbi:MAG: hypothetical protein ACE15D_01685 [Candidatus Eisenbacteria bacterium]|nr:hypothetical protein [Candidatus Eisenbacteria bacterium]
MRFASRGFAGLLLLALVAGVAGGAWAQKVQFSGPPVLGDRKITWSWQPLDGLDPYFQGNTVLEEEGTLPAPAGAGAASMLRTNGGTQLFVVGSLDPRIYVIDEVSGAVQKISPQPPSPIADFVVHGSGRIVLAGFADGTVGLWNLDTDTWDVYAAERTNARIVRFLVNSNELSELRYVTAGESDTIQVWAGPGSLLRKIATAGSPTVRMALATNGSLLAAGDAQGNVRIYQPIASSSIFQRLQAHESEIRDLVFSADLARLFSLDAGGRLVGWETRSWTSRFTKETGTVTDPMLGIRDPDGALVYVLQRTGDFAIYDGKDGRLYRQADLATQGDITAARVADLGRTIFVALPDGTIPYYRTGFCQPSARDPVCFGGYMIWRSETPRAEDAQLVRMFGFGDSTWTFVGSERRFTDPDSLVAGRGAGEDPLAGPHNGFPWYYSITAFSRQYLGGSVFDVLLNTVDEGWYRADPNGPPTPVTAHSAAETSAPLLGRVVVVPNPYEAGKVPWDRELGEHVEFRNLPEQATIRIYTTSGDLLRTLEHGPGDFGETSSAKRWDLKNARGEAVTSGVYIYYISTRLNSEEAKGYFIVVR